MEKLSREDQVKLNWLLIDAVVLYEDTAANNMAESMDPELCLERLRDASAKIVRAKGIIGKLVDNGH